MTKTLLIIIGISCALVSAAGIMWYNYPLREVRGWLDDKDWHKRLDAVRLLREINDRESTPKIRQIFLNHEYPIVSFNALWTLVEWNDRESIPEIKKLLNDKNENVRKEAEDALKTLGVPAEEIEEAKENK